MTNIREYLHDGRHYHERDIPTDYVIEPCDHAANYHAAKEWVEAEAKRIIDLHPRHRKAAIRAWRTALRRGVYGKGSHLFDPETDRDYDEIEALLYQWVELYQKGEQLNP